MRAKIFLAAVLAVAVVGLVSLAKSEVPWKPETAVSFQDRWAPVDEAVRSGSFAVKDSHDR